MNRLDSDLLFKIIKRLPLKNKLVLKAVCKKWHSLLISLILPKQDKLSLENDYFSDCRCIDPDHQFKLHDNNSIPVLAFKTRGNRKRFIEKEVTGVKVLKLCRGQAAKEVMKLCLSQESFSSLECLDIYCLGKPLVKVLPNLKHFSAENINSVSFVSVLQFCPVLTHLSIETSRCRDNFVNGLINLPKGLQYLDWGGWKSDFLAVLCSPAMETLECVLLENWDTPAEFHKPDVAVKPAPRLQRFSMSYCILREEDRKSIFDFLKECPALTEIDLRITGLTLEDYVNIYSGLSNLEMIRLDLEFEFDDLIRMILWRNRDSLNNLLIKKPLLNLESMKELAEFSNLKTLCFSTLVRIFVLSNI